MVTYLTQLLGMPALEPDGTRAAKVLDVIASQGGRFPVISAIFLKSKTREGWIALDGAEIQESAVQLKSRWSDTQVYEPAPTDIRLQRDILDKQIVDVHDYRVVRVNDVRIATSSNNYCVIGADASLRAIIRRIPGGKGVEAVAKLFKQTMHSKLIAWDVVEALEPGAAGGGRIKLKVPHEKIARLHPADIADIIEQLDPKQRVEVIGALTVETAADTIEEMEEEEAAAVMSTLDEETAADILDEMDPDDAADLLADLTDERSEDLLDHMEPEEAAEVKELLLYGEDTAGGMMTNEFIAVLATMTCGKTIKYLREIAPRAEIIYYVYVVDEDERLLGVISLRDLIVSPPKVTIAEIMKENVRFVRTGDHTDEVAHIVNRYSLLALPVVDEASTLVGIIMVDDVMEKLVGPVKRRKLPQLQVEEELISP